MIPVISADVLAGIRTPSLDSLQKSLICSYSAERADVYLVYPSISRGFFPLRTTFPASGNTRISTPQDWPYQVQPIELSVLSLVDIQKFEYHGFRYAVEHSGGISVFLFLFAYVLENSKCEKDIPPALNILLKLLSKHTFFAEDFIRIKGFELLTQMITNSKCVITCELFEVLLQNSVDYNFLNKNVSKGLNLPENLAIITNASIFSLLLKSVAFAKNTSDSVLTSLFSVLDLLLNPKHANVSMNVEKLNHIEALKTLLWLVKKIYIMSDDISLPSVVIKMIPILIEKLLKYKSDGLVFQSICNFLLLLHNASSTYVCHSRSAFFYLLPLDTLDIKKIPSERLSTNLSCVDIENDSLTLPSSPVFHSEMQFKRPASVPNTFYKPLGSEETYFNISKIRSLNNLKEHQRSPALSTFEVLNSFENMKESSTVANELKWKLKIEKDVNMLPVRYTEEEKSTEMCLGLMKLVFNFITRTRDVTAVLKLVKPEIFIILAYTKNPEVCALAIKVIDAYLKAADEEVRNEFLNMKGFHLLANQLFHCPFEVQIIDACFSIIYDCPLSSVKESQIPECRTPSNFRVMAWLPLLALLPNGGAYEDLCHIILLSLNQFLRIDSTFIMNLLDNGLVISLIHLVLALSHSSRISKNNHSLLELNSCLKVIGTILQLLASELCSSKHFKEFLALRDILHLFTIFESRCGEECGLNTQCVTCLRSCQCVMFQVVVNFTEMYSSYSSKSGISFLPDAEEAVEPEKLSVQSDVQKAFREVSVSEVVDRLEVLIEAATHFIIYRDPRIKIYGKEKEFIKQFFCFLIKGLAIAKDKCVIKSRYLVLMFSMKDSFKKQLGNLLMSCFAVYEDTEVKQYIVEILSAHPLNKMLLQLVTFSVDRIENFLILLNDLQDEESSQTFKKNTSILYNIVKDLLEKSSYLEILKNSVEVEKSKLEWTNFWHENRNKWIADASNSKEKIHKKMEKLSQEVSTFALNVTQNIFKMQTDERKVFIEELKHKYYEEASERMSWLKLSEQMTHERAVWHIKESYPYSWELDPTEGPFRVRRRLRRCYVDIEPRFLKPEFAEKLLNLKKEQPFINLLLHHNEFSDSAAVLYRLHTNEQIEFTCTCKIVTAFEEGDVEILIGACCIHLIGQETSSFTKRHPISESWPFETIEEIVPRRYELQNNAFEIFFTNGLTYLIAFRDQKDFQCIWKQLESRGLPCQRYSDVNALTQLWQEGTITNFEYLTQLNKLAGRSFNDLMQYPVFPFILSDYSSQYLNINDPSVYRNFAKPVAIQHKYREKFYCDLYNLLKEQTGESELPISAPYHYGSHYSNSGVVLHFLIRLLPYTYHFIKYQDNNFDIPDRAFHSIESSWQLVTKDTTSDVKEIIPEFFFLPEFLCNQNGFDFGVRQSGIRVNDVLLPPWCKQNPRLFILIHRQALESETVKNSINNWIDLVFGYKQTGEAAINAINVFHPATYYGFDVNQSEDPITKQALKVMIKTLGQMPKQLFYNPHPMVSLSLSCLGLMDEKSSTMEVIDTVTGLRWGSYVGSPSTGIPSLVWCRKQNVVLGSFLPLLTNYVFGLGENICLLLNHKKDSSSNILSATYIMSAALVSWGHTDGIVRIKLCRDQPAIPLLKGSVIDPVCLCASVPDCKELFVAHSSGIIYVYTLNLDPSKFSVSQKNPPLLLQAHSGEITSIHICKAFSIFVTTSVDKAVVIWDLNRLCYVRSIISHENAVKLVCVSDTLGDIASVSDSGLNSCMAVHTINGEMVAKVEITEIVTAVCYSAAPEGISVNVIATGLQTGAIRLWSSWDLKPVREIISDKFLLPIRCVTFSADNQHIYASNENGTVAVWEKPSKGLTSVPKLLVFT
ncbi:Lysosomal-trafficking regulator, partial [Stegodyphus mimosarum]